jgi:hypothetical protein
VIFLVLSIVVYLFILYEILIYLFYDNWFTCHPNPSPITASQHLHSNNQKFQQQEKDLSHSYYQQPHQDHCRTNPEMNYFSTKSYLEWLWNFITEHMIGFDSPSTLRHRSAAYRYHGSIYQQIQEMLYKPPSDGTIYSEKDIRVSLSSLYEIS